MAKDFPDENELLEQIRADKIKVDPKVWTLISHHTGNDLQAISWIISLTMDDLKAEGLTDKAQLIEDLNKVKHHSDSLIKKIKLLKEALWAQEIGD
jgi:hypothetical protein